MRNLHIKNGELIEFPVPPGHHLEPLQSLVLLNSVDQLRPFPAFIEQWTASACSAGVTDPKAALPGYISALSTQLLVIEVDSLHIDHGGVMVINSPFTHIVVQTKFVVAGTLHCPGHLGVECHELRGGSGDTTSYSGPAAGGINHGNDPPPPQPPQPGPGGQGGLTQSGQPGPPGTPGTRGLDGGAGAGGAPGTTYSNTVCILGPGLNLDKSGQQGGAGGSGGPGGPGGQGGKGGGGKIFTDGGAGGKGGKGGDGGDGGKGGKGGDGGRIIIIYEIDASGGTNTYNVNAGSAGSNGVGGAPGAPGPGGPGGSGGFTPLGNTGPDGPQGDPGNPGKTPTDTLGPGAAGVVTLQQVNLGCRQGVAPHASAAPVPSDCSGRRPLPGGAIIIPKE
jgi:hypothetical protein